MRSLVVVGLLLVAGAARAEDSPSNPAAALIDGVYLSTAELCEQAKADGIDAVAAEGNLVLNAEKLQSVEYHCDFVDVRPSGDYAVVVTAYCEEPGAAYPDVMAITRRQENQLEITSVRDQPELPAGNTGTYVRCDGLTMP